MTRPRSHKWEFRRYFRARAFGWRSKPAITRIREAVSEIKRVARKEPEVAAEGAVLLLERLSPALEMVDSSSGAIGTAINRAIAALVPIIAAAPADHEQRDAWLERLWQAYEEDEIPYIEALGDCWGELCASPEVASQWADRLLPGCRRVWQPEAPLTAFFHGTSNCLSALLAAGRNQEILDLLAMTSRPFWSYHKYGVKALAARGEIDAAIRYAEECEEPYLGSNAVARVCEEVLLAAGRTEEAYRRYGLRANRANTYLAWFRAVARKYPDKESAEILADLVEQTPEEEGKWFAAAKAAKLFDAAIALANRTPCAPQTLTRAARDFVETNPTFALEAGITALRWLVEGYGYDITNRDVLDAYNYTLQAAGHADRVKATRERIRALVAQEPPGGDHFVSRVLGSELGLA